jgi:hypothetical protein
LVIWGNGGTIYACFIWGIGGRGVSKKLASSLTFKLMNKKKSPNSEPAEPRENLGESDWSFEVLDETGAICIECRMRKDGEELPLLRRWGTTRPFWALAIPHEDNLCHKCWEKRFARYLSAGFSLADAGVWSDVCSGIDDAVAWRDAGFTIADITDWCDYFENSTVAATWRKVGFRAIEAFHWAKLFTSSDVAATWRKAGFSSSLDQSWIEWGLSPQQVIDCIDSVDKFSGEIDYPWFSETTAPDINYRVEWGLGFHEAVCCWKNALFASFDYSYRPPRKTQSLEYWMSTGLNLDEILALREVVDESEELVSKHWELRTKVKNWTPDITEFLPKVWGALRKVGVPVNFKNILNFWGLSDKQILRVIDNGGDVNSVANRVLAGITASQAKFVEHLMSMSVDEESAVRLVKRGFSTKSLGQFEQSGYDLRDFIAVCNELDKLKVDEIMKWFLVDVGTSQYAWTRRIPAWYRCGFAPDTAALWYREEFSAKEASSWLKSGIKTPAIAKRRKAAGISPKTAS